MKKLLILLLILSVPLGTYAKSFLDLQIEETKKNNQYNTAQKYKEDSYELLRQDISKEQAALVKDPGLYSFARYNEISDADYKKKIELDESIYKNKIASSFYELNKSEEEGINYYRVYRICERMIRANNLDYINWRIAIRKTPDINAASTDTNFVLINTGLYDSIGNNDEALAFVIGHEIAHQILGHRARSQEINAQKYYLVKRLQEAQKTPEGQVSVPIFRKKIFDLYEEERQMEYMADSEGLKLIITAGYSPEKAIETLNFLDSLQGRTVNVLDDHPHTVFRIKNYKNEVLAADPNWGNIGKENIYASEVLPVRKSSDRVTIIISKSDNPKKIYKPESVNERLSRTAYVLYKKGYLGGAKNYFQKLAELNKNNYLPYLYISYADVAHYKFYRDNKYLKHAEKAIKKASKLAPTSPYVKEQIEEIETLKQQAKTDPLAHK